MAVVRKTMNLVEKSQGNINPNYDMYASNIEDIEKASNNIYEMICNGFRFGYMQGKKAAMAEMKKMQ
jgi:hypothetical protein